MIFLCFGATLQPPKIKLSKWVANRFIRKEKMGKMTGTLSGACLALLWRRYVSFNRVKHDIHN